MNKFLSHKTWNHSEIVISYPLWWVWDNLETIHITANPVFPHEDQAHGNGFSFKNLGAIEVVAGLPIHVGNEKSGMSDFCCKWEHRRSRYGQVSSPGRLVSSFNTRIIKYINVLENPKDMKCHSYNPCFILNAIFHSPNDNCSLGRVQEQSCTIKNI